MPIVDKLYLNSTSEKHIDDFLQENKLYQIDLIRELFESEDSRNYNNWIKGRTTIKKIELDKLCAKLALSLEEFTGEVFDKDYLSKKDSLRIKKLFNAKECENPYEYELIANMLHVESSTLKNWVYGYSCITLQQYQQLVNALNIAPWPLKKTKQPITKKVDEVDFKNNQQLRIFLLQNQALLLEAPKNIPQHIVDKLIKLSDIPEKNVILFYHDANVRKDFYAVIHVHGKPSHCILSFAHNSRITNYGEVCTSEDHILYQNLCSGMRGIIDNVDELKIATWFGSESCLFAIRSAEYFTISINRDLSVEEVLADENMVIFLQ